MAHHALQCNVWRHGVDACLLLFTSSGADRGSTCVQGVRKRPAADVAEEGPTEDDMAATMLPRKQRNLYASIQKQTKAKRARVQELERRRAALAED